VPDPVLQDPVGRQSDRVADALGFKELVHLGVAESRVAPEIESLHAAPVARDHRLQHRAPAISAVHVARPQDAALDIAELVEHEQRVIAGAAEMAVVGAAFLLAVGRALARIHVEHNHPRRSPLVHLVDPPAGQIGEHGEVLLPAQPLRLEAAHLAGRSGKPGNRPVAHHPAHRRIATQPLGVVHVLVTGQPPEHRLPQQPDQQMPSVLAGACLGQSLASACGQSKNVVQFAIGQQSAIGGDHRTVELEPQAAVEIEPQRLGVRFTRRVRHRRPVRPIIRR
jgi:hypothetical protein